jgi:UDP-glucose 4-epimerase
MPFVTQVAVGRKPHLSMFGNDYATADGTGERDYIHVVDLARAHLAAIDYTLAHHGCDAFNIGTGAAYSVLQIVAAFERASGQEIPYKVSARRAGDIATSVARVDKARDTLGWTSSHTLDDICQSSWNWQSKNPAGYSNT